MKFNFAFIFATMSLAQAFMPSSTKPNKIQLYMSNHQSKESIDRKDFLQFAASLSAMTFVPSANAVERAVGAAEKSCREEGNCLEKFDIDGAVGWNWGGRDRCDATDPMCGPDGKIRDAPLTGDAVPPPVDAAGNELKVTNVMQIEMQIGKMEKGKINIGFYGDAYPASVGQFLHFISDGIVTSSKLMLEDGFGVSTQPVCFADSGAGVLNVIYPQSRVDFGIPSQGLAYAKTRRMNKIPDNFVSQARPSGEIVDSISKEKSVRPHSMAGLVSISKNGLGYGGLGLDSDDEAFASSFQITASNVPAMDKEGRKVIGQILDEESMAFLARLASSPTKKGLKGIIPGQNAGPPLVKTTITAVNVQ